MSKAKETILQHVRSALENVPENESPADVSVPRDYRQKGNSSRDELVSLFIDRLSEYKATVHKVSETELPDIITKSCHREKVKELVVPAGFPSQWLPDSLAPMYDDPQSPLTHQQLDDSDGVITTCALAVAETGSIILDAGPGQGRRVLSLLPDYHLCIVRVAQIVELVPEGFAHFEERVKNEGPPITFISGPSATSDIELSRVEGVHGPRKLEVLIMGI